MHLKQWYNERQTTIVSNIEATSTNGLQNSTYIASNNTSFKAQSTAPSHTNDNYDY